MKALLVTRCGCSKTVDIAGPAERIYITLHDREMQYIDAPPLAPSDLDRREFKFDNRDVRLPGSEVKFLVYVEVKK